MEEMLHELLHAIGFEHEQLHKKFPWDDSQSESDETLSKNRLLHHEIAKAYGNRTKTADGRR